VTKVSPRLSEQVDFILKAEQPVFNVKGHLVASVLQTNDRGAGDSPGKQA